MKEGTFREKKGWRTKWVAEVTMAIHLVWEYKIILLLRLSTPWILKVKTSFRSSKWSSLEFNSFHSNLSPNINYSDIKSSLNFRDSTACQFESFNLSVIFVIWDDIEFCFDNIIMLQWTTSFEIEMVSSVCLTDRELIYLSWKKCDYIVKMMRKRKKRRKIN